VEEQIKKLSQIQLFVMRSDNIPNDTANEVSELLGNAKELLANVKEKRN